MLQNFKIYAEGIGKMLKKLHNKNADIIWSEGDLQGVQAGAQLHKGQGSGQVTGFLCKGTAPA